MCVSLAAALDLQQVADESTAYFSRANGEREGGVGWRVRGGGCRITDLSKEAAQYWGKKQLHSDAFTWYRADTVTD